MSCGSENGRVDWGSEGHLLTTIPLLPWESKASLTSPVPYIPGSFCEPSDVFPGCPPTLSLPCVPTPRLFGSLALWPFGPLALWPFGVGPFTYSRCGSASPFALCGPYRQTSGSEPSGGTQEGTPLTTGCLAVGPVLARQLVACVSLSFLLSVTPTVRRA